MSKELVMGVLMELYTMAGYVIMAKDAWISTIVEVFSNGGYA